MSADVELRFGYTLADLQRVARGAAATTRAMAGDYDDRYAEAFGAAAERLYEAEHWIPEHQLFRAAQDALWEQSRKDRSYHGCAYRHGEGWGENGSGPNFVRYWSGVGAPTPSPENRVLERLALEQILPTLRPGWLEALAALAALGDHAAAQAALGLTQGCYSTRVSYGRRAFLALWHEGEEPSKPWGIDRRGAVRNATAIIRRRQAKARDTRG